MNPITIASARVSEIVLPLRVPFRISGGTMTERRSLLVELTDVTGRRGMGESAPFDAPFYSSETIDSARLCLERHLLPAVLGQRFLDVGDVHALLAERVRGNYMARAGVETAWWDLCAATEATTLADLVARRLTSLGVANGVGRQAVRCGVALGIPTGGAAQLREWVADAVSAGYHRIKLKVDREWHTEPVRVALETLRELGAAPAVTVDANGAYHPESDDGVLTELDQAGLAFIEQPFAPDAIFAAVAWARGRRTPICLDETLTSPALAVGLAAERGQWIWNIKVQRVGGLEPACQLAALAAAHRIPLWAGTMPESGIGAQATLALASHELFALPTDLEPSERWYAPGTDPLPLTMHHGAISVPQDRQSVPLPGRLVCELRAAG